MNRCISDCNTFLNLAVSPSLLFMSSKLTILKNPIEGHNNRLKTAIASMDFGVKRWTKEAIHFPAI